MPLSTAHGSLSLAALVATVLAGACAPPALEPVWADEFTSAWRCRARSICRDPTSCAT